MRGAGGFASSVLTVCEASNAPRADFSDALAPGSNPGIWNGRSFNAVRLPEGRAGARGRHPQARTRRALPTAATDEACAFRAVRTGGVWGRAGGVGRICVSPRKSGGRRGAARAPPLSPRGRGVGGEGAVETGRGAGNALSSHRLNRTLRAPEPIARPTLAESARAFAAQNAPRFVLRTAAHPTRGEGIGGGFCDGETARRRLARCRDDRS